MTTHPTPFGIVSAKGLRASSDMFEIVSMPV
jgi:hypothetical protein